MKHLPFGRIVSLRLEADVLLSAVNTITDEGKPKVLKVHANLVGSASMEQPLHKGRAAQPFQDPIARPCFTTSARLRNRHGTSMRGMTRNRGANFAPRTRQIAAENGVV